MLVDLELHPEWPSEWDGEKRERATMALCTHLMNSRVHTLHGLQTRFAAATPDRVLGATGNPRQYRDKILLTLEIGEHDVPS